MLTKELLRYKTIRGKILPKFIDPKDQKLLKIAEELIETFSASVGSVRETLEESSKQILDGFPSKPMVGRGLEKLLLDRTEFDTELNNELIEFRERVFKNSSRLLHQNEKAKNLDLESYQSEITKAMEIKVEMLGDKLYGDLPPFQQVLNFKNMSAEELLHRYNCAQVQGLLLRCEGITVILQESGVGKLRQLLKYLRFNKLLAKFNYHKNNKKALVLNIDGPLSLFVQTQKYGLNLANFFGALLLQPRWELIAQIRLLKNQVHTLHLNQSCGIHSHLHQFLSYVPDEIQIIIEKISKKLLDWELTTSSDFVPLVGESLCFPDYLLTHKSGKTVSLELFHRWHSNPLKSRLDQLDSQTDSPLIIGINKSLLNDDQIATQVDASKYFSGFGFIFSEVPTATKLLPVLESWVKDNSS